MEYKRLNKIRKIIYSVAAVLIIAAAGFFGWLYQKHQKQLTINNSISQPKNSPTAISPTAAPVIAENDPIPSAISTDSTSSASLFDCPAGTAQCIRGEIVVKVNGELSTDKIIDDLENARISLSDQGKQNIIAAQSQLSPAINAGKYYFKLKVESFKEKETFEKISSIGPDYDAYYSTVGYRY